LTSTQDFLSSLPTANAVASVASSVRSAANDLEQREHGDRVEEVEADHALGPRQLARPCRHRQRRGVGREDALRPDDRLELGEHLLLDVELLEHGLDDEVGVGEDVLAREPVMRPLSRLALSAVSLPFANRSSSWPCAQPTPLSTRAWSRSVMTTGTFSRCAKSRASWPAIRPAPTTPTFVTARARSFGGAPTGRFARRCTRSNA
jgi:hypothetical protein